MIREQCRTSGIKVSAIGSPIGKSPLAQPPEQELENLERAFEIASALGVRLVRVFSFYPPEGAPPAAYDRYVAESIERLSELAALAERRGFTLLLENEKGIVGDTIARCHALLAGVDSPALRFAWDPANFVQVGEDAPTEDGWPALGSHVAHVHVKDALANGEVRPAGQGDGQVGMLLDRLRTPRLFGLLGVGTASGHRRAQQRFQRRGGHGARHGCTPAAYGATPGSRGCSCVALPGHLSYNPRSRRISERICAHPQR